MKIQSLGYGNNQFFAKSAHVTNKNVSFKGIEEVVKEEGDQWKPKNDKSEVHRTVSYHPFFDEKPSEYPDSIDKTTKLNLHTGIYKQIITTTTTLGETMPVTKAEAKRIPYDVLLSMASRLKKSVKDIK